MGNNVTQQRIDEAFDSVLEDIVNYVNDYSSPDPDKVNDKNKRILETIKEVLTILPAQQLEALAKGEAWQPIETAPKDGERILVCGGKVYSTCGGCKWFDNEDVIIVTWSKFEKEFYIPDDSYGNAIEPTHWMPLPIPQKGNDDE